MTSMRFQDHPFTQRRHKCQNETCSQWFSITEDIRQLYCCSACKKAQHSRRSNRRKREREALRAQAIQEAANTVSRIQYAMQETTGARLRSFSRSATGDVTLHLNDNNTIVLYRSSFRNQRAFEDVVESMIDYYKPVKLPYILRYQPGMPVKRHEELKAQAVDQAVNCLVDHIRDVLETEMELNSKFYDHTRDIMDWVTMSTWKAIADRLAANYETVDIDKFITRKKTS